MRPASWYQHRPALVALLALSGAAETLSAEEIPYFARKYRVACTQCHVAPPKLNDFGEAFVAAGYEMPSLQANRTWPFAVWVSGRSDSRLPGSAEDDVRAFALRAFSPSGHSPSLRLGLHREAGRLGRWSTHLALPFSGEFSIPLTSEARIEASNELELNPKGIFVESFVRYGLTSIGAHAFYDSDPDRYLANAVTTGSYRELHWTGILGVAKSGDVTRGRWSIEGELFPAKLRGFLAVGGRVEDQGGDGVEHAVVPYLNAHFPGTRYTFRLTLERRLQRDRNATFLEIGTVL